MERKRTHATVRKDSSSTFCNKIGFTCRVFYRPKANLFYSKWHNSRVWRDSSVNLSNQKPGGLEGISFPHSPCYSTTLFLFGVNIQRETLDWLILYRPRPPSPLLTRLRLMGKIEVHQIIILKHTLSCSLKASHGLAIIQSVPTPWFKRVFNLFQRFAQDCLSGVSQHRLNRPWARLRWFNFDSFEKKTFYRVYNRKGHHGGLVTKKMSH